MSLLLRLLGMYIRSRFLPGIGIQEPSVITLRVYPNDLDLYGHVNNGRYLTLMDIGRVDLMLRTGMWKLARKNKWNPLVASISIDYKKSLGLFDRFTLITRITGWDDKWFFIEQIFEKNGNIYARASVKGIFRGPEGNVPSAKLVSHAASQKRERRDG